MKTVVANPGERFDSSETDETFNRRLELAKEQYNLGRFGLLRFEDYCRWILENQIPLS